jgi:peroxiredoxin
MLTPANQPDPQVTAPDFELPGTDGATYTRDAVRGKNGLLVMFLCNHCPYVKAVIARLNDDCRALQAQGFGCVAIMSNDTVQYPEDGFDRMQAFAAQHGLCFPYLYDASQAVAHAYQAVCTPDFFGFNRDLQLRYRGRLDPYGLKDAPAQQRERELLDAMTGLRVSDAVPAGQSPSIGCSIKWR